VKLYPPECSGYASRDFCTPFSHQIAEIGKFGIGIAIFPGPAAGRANSRTSASFTIDFVRIQVNILAGTMTHGAFAVTHKEAAVTIRASASSHL
jgi:hypothetical protein